jgi:hypothetical protein
VRALQIRSHWRPLVAAETTALEPAIGVYEIRVDGVVRLIGYAGARSLFGLRGELTALAGTIPGAEFRAEVTSAYLTRWHELLGAHVATFGCPPPDNDPGGLPRPLLPIGPRGDATP